MIEMRVLFFGNGFDYSLAFLRAVAQSPVELVAIVAPVHGYDRSSWRRIAKEAPKRLAQGGGARDGVERFPMEVVRTAHRTGARVFWPWTIHDRALWETLAAMNADLVIMAGFNQILKAKMLARLPPVWNVHPSLLPKFRGPHPEFWIVSSGQVESGVTIHRVDAKIDTGPIVAQERFAVEPWLTGGGLQQRVLERGALLLHDILLLALEGDLPEIAQEGEGSYQGVVQPGHLSVRPELGVEAVYNVARAASPWMSLHTYVPAHWWLYSKDHREHSCISPCPGARHVELDLRGATPFLGYETSDKPGTIYRIERGGVVVICRDGAVSFSRVRSIG